MKRNKLSVFPIRSWMPYLFFTAFVGSILVISVILVSQLRDRESDKMQIFIEAMKLQQKKWMPDPEVQQLLFTIFTKNDQMPMIITDSNRNPILAEGFSRNISKEILNNPELLHNKMKEMESHHTPIILKISDKEIQYVYYDNSKLLNNLKLFPIGLGFFFLIYLAFSFWIFRSLKSRDESLLWAGFAKETAHQIGTPLSSLMGWVAVLEDKDAEAPEVQYMKQDIQRLVTISERFSKIGSIPDLNDTDLSKTIRDNYHYLRKRVPGKIEFSLDMPKEPIILQHNNILIGWVLENLVTNAADAMRGKGKLNIRLNSDGPGKAYFDVCDDGCGMTTKQIRNAFNAGFTTKKRGWGLGLSLVKRAVELIHQGEVLILESQIGKGTTFRVRIKNGKMG